MEEKKKREGEIVDEEEAECTRNNPEPLCCTPFFHGSLRGPFEERGSDLERVFPRSPLEERRILCIFLRLARARKYFQKGNPNVCLYRWRGESGG